MQSINIIWIRYNQRWGSVRKSNLIQRVVTSEDNLIHKCKLDSPSNFLKENCQKLVLILRIMLMYMLRWCMVRVYLFLLIAIYHWVDKIDIVPSIKQLWQPPKCFSLTNVIKPTVHRTQKNKETDIHVNLSQIHRCYPAVKWVRINQTMTNIESTKQCYGTPSMLLLLQSMLPFSSLFPVENKHKSNLITRVIKSLQRTVDL